MHHLQTFYFFVFEYGGISPSLCYWLAHICRTLTCFLLQSFLSFMQHSQKLYIRSTGVSPSRRIPLLNTIRAESYRAMRAFMISGSVPTILRWS